MYVNQRAGGPVERLHRQADVPCSDTENSQCPPLVKGWVGQTGLEVAWASQHLHIDNFICSTISYAIYLCIRKQPTRQRHLCQLSGSGDTTEKRRFL
jgi:hypothetical protein